MFLRGGDLPPNGMSLLWDMAEMDADGGMIVENRLVEGVCAFDLVEDDDGDYCIPYSDGIEELVEMFLEDRPCFELDGALIGRGKADEPLVRVSECRPVRDAGLYVQENPCLMSRNAGRYMKYGRFEAGRLIVERKGFAWEEEE